MRELGRERERERVKAGRVFWLRVNDKDVFVYTASTHCLPWGRGQRSVSK